MLELNLAIYYRAASLPLQASYAVLAQESLTRPGFRHTNSSSNSAILHDNYISLLSSLCACVHGKKKWRRKGSHSSSVSGSNRLMWLRTWKKAMGGALLSEKCCCFVQNHRESVTQIWTSPSEEEEERRKKNILAVWRLSGLVLWRCFLAPLGVLFVMKTIEDER